MSSTQSKPSPAANARTSANTRSPRTALTKPSCMMPSCNKDRLISNSELRSILSRLQQLRHGLRQNPFAFRAGQGHGCFVAAFEVRLGRRNITETILAIAGDADEGIFAHRLSP